MQSECRLNLQPQPFLLHENRLRFLLFGFSFSGNDVKQRSELRTSLLLKSAVYKRDRGPAYCTTPAEQHQNEIDTWLRLRVEAN